MQDAEGTFLIQQPRRWPWTWYAGAGLAVLLVCWLPELAPVAPNVADSYTFGFNNRVALPLLLALIAAGALLTRGFGMPLFAPEPAGTSAIPRSTLYRGLGVIGAMCAAMWVLTHGLAGFTESTDLIDRVRLAAEGQRPYLDFEYAYGAALVYGPLWTARLLHVSVVNGYFAWWTANSLFGCWLIYRILNLAAYPTPARRTLFWLCVAFAAQTALSTGVNYTFLRFALGPWFAVEAQRVLQPESARPRFLRAGLLCAVGFYATLLVSPEMGLAFLAGSLFWLAVNRAPWTPNRWGGLLLTAGAAGLGIPVAAHFRYFELMRVMSRGGSNDPYMPALHLLLLFACLAAAAAWLRARWSAPATWTDSMSAILLISLPMLASALGRCDPAHVFFGAVGIQLAGLLLLSRTVLWKAACTAVLLAYFVFPALLLHDTLLLMGKAVSHLVLSGDPQHEGPVMHVVEALAAHVMGPATAAHKIAKSRQASNVPDVLDFDQLYPGASAVLQLPFAYLPNGFSRYHSPRLDEGRYFGLQNVLAPQQVQVKIGELAAHPERDLLLSKDFPQCGVDPVEARNTLRQLFFFPYMRRAVHTDSVAEPLCDYIQANYVRAIPASIENYEYALWKHR